MLAAYLLLWQVIAVVVDKELLIPPPLGVLRRLAALLFEKSFWLAALGSLLRVMAGYLLGVFAGAICAGACFVSGVVRAFLSPMLKAVRATPVASFIILALIWLSPDATPAFVSFLIVLPVVYGNIYQGLSSTDAKLLEMARVFKIGAVRTATRIYIPCMLPYFFAAATTALGLAWKAGIAAEVLSRARYSIGGALYDSKIYLETADLFAWTLIVIILSILLENLLVGVMGPLKRRYETLGGGTGEGGA